MNYEVLNGESCGRTRVWRKGVSRASPASDSRVAQDPLLIVVHVCRD